MKKRKSSIILSSRKAKKYVYFLAVFYLLYIISFGLFLVFPQRFYFRSWEYFKELAFRVPDRPKWKGPEFGGNSRDYIYSFQQSRDSEVSCDEFGFRKTLYSAEEYPIFFFGASNTWGDTLSDSETIPWIVSEKLQVPILNGGITSGSLSKLLNFYKVKNAKIVVELIDEARLNKPDSLLLDFNQEEFVPETSAQSYWNVFEVHPKRFFLPLKALRFLSLKCMINELSRDKFDDFHILHHDEHPYHIKKPRAKKSIERIEQRSALMEQRGYTYICAILPNKITTLGPILKEKQLEAAKSYRTLLQSKGIHYVDVLQKIHQEENKRKYYSPNDGHLSKVAARLIGETIANYLSTHFDIQALRPPVSEPVNPQFPLYDETDLFSN